MTMKKFLLLFCLLPCLGYGQYWGERVTEKSFEQSSLYFKSYFLNPYGLHRFGDAAVGLIDDSFLRLHLNPANLPEIDGKDYLIYLDFRGDRTEEEVIGNYYAMPVYDMYYYPDRRWYNITRDEPQPTLSFGILSYPMGRKRNGPFLGGTYQMIYKQEKYYTVPTWNYIYRFGYDAFGENTLVDAPIIPVEDRYFGKDELLTQAHLFSLFTGFAPSEKLTFGLSLNRTIHSRDGGYINSRNDEYGVSYDYEWHRYEEESRNQDYDHIDISGGIIYQFSKELTGGAKIGYLSGSADQSYLTLDSSEYSWNNPDVSTRWGYNISSSRTDKAWNRDGDTWYGRISLERKIDTDKKISAYYRYGRSNIDITNSLTVRDTSYYASQYSYDMMTYNHEGFSWTHDDRAGYGSRKEYSHQAMISNQWRLKNNHTVYAGSYFARNKTVQHSNEPVIAERWSESQYEVNGNPSYSYQRGMFEDKFLVWEYESTYWTLQIPVMLKIKTADFLHITFGVNRILEGWKTSDITTAYFTLREENDNGAIDSESYFGERYTLPEENITEDETAIITNFDISVSDQFNIRLLINPEIEDDFRIAEWWLSFQFKP
ncbi:MAG: hypothetical protein V3V99_11540 [candidate division Zixibacteria bacterium]